MLRSGSSVHQHELLAVRKPTFRDFFCKRGRDVGKYVGECGERKGCWEGGKFFGKYLGKSGDFRLRIFQCFLIPDQNPKSMFFKTNNMALIFYPD